MILVTVGTHNAGFNRLVTAVDAYAALTDERVVIQRGVSSQVPEHAEHFEFTSYEEMQRLTREARVVVTQASAGAILMGLKMGKALVLVPRRMKYQEIFDDHQLELTRALSGTGRVVECVPITAEGLCAAIQAAQEISPTMGGEHTLVENLKQKLADWSD